MSEVSEMSVLENAIRQQTELQAEGLAKVSELSGRHVRLIDAMSDAGRPCPRNITCRDVFPLEHALNGSAQPSEPGETPAAETPGG